MNREMIDILTDECLENDMERHLSFDLFLVGEFAWRSDIKWDEKCVYAVLRQLANANGYTWVQSYFLGKVMNLSDEVLKRVLENLEKSNLIRSKTFTLRKMRRRRIYLIPQIQTAPKETVAQNPAFQIP